MISKLLPLFAFIVALLTFFLYVDPTYTGEIGAKQLAIASDNQALAAATAYTTKENELISAEKQIDPDALARLTKFLPDSANNIGLIIDINALAAKDGITLSGINVAQPTAATTPDPSSPAYSSVDMTLSALGSYSAFHTFLSSIEKSARLLDITKLSVSGSDTGVYTYDMSLRLYWLQ